MTMLCYQVLFMRQFPTYWTPLLLWKVATKCMFSVGRKRKGYSNPPSVRSVGPEIYTTCPSEVSQIMVKQEGELNSPCCSYCGSFSCNLQFPDTPHILGYILILLESKAIEQQRGLSSSLFIYKYDLKRSLDSRVVHSVGTTMPAVWNEGSSTVGVERAWDP